VRDAIARGAIGFDAEGLDHIRFLLRLAELNASARSQRGLEYRPIR
jgi:hypothetical protein